MKALIVVAILILVYFGARSLLDEWKSVQTSPPDGAPAATPSTPPSASASASLPGLPAHLEASLSAALRQGPDALKTWLKRHRASVSDPRLADIELDYVVMVGGKDFGEACDVLASVQARTPPDSPIMPKIQKLEKTYRRADAD